MKETKKFDKWIGLLSISVVAIIIFVFILTVSDTHVAKGTNALTDKYCSCEEYYVEGTIAYDCSCTYASQTACNSGTNQECTQETTTCQLLTCWVPNGKPLSTNAHYCFKCTDSGIWQRLNCNYDSCQAECEANGGEFTDNMNLHQHNGTCSNASSTTATTNPCSGTDRTVSNFDECDAIGKAGNYQYGYTATLYMPQSGSKQCCKIIPNSVELCYCNSCVDGSWQSVGMISTGDEQTCKNSIPTSRCSGTNAVVSWKNPVTKNGCPTSTGDNGSHNSTGNIDNTPTVTPTGGSNNATNGNNSPAETGNDSGSNPQTGAVGIIIAWVVGLAAIVYSLWYFKKSSSIKG